MSVEKKALGAVADLCLGKMLDQKGNRGEPRPYLGNVNVRWASFDFDNLKQMKFEARELERYGLRFGDIVMCEGGEPGRCALWMDQSPGMMIQKALHRIRPHPFMDSRFLFYSLLRKGMAGELEAYFTGATIKHLPSEQLAKIEIEIPPLETQRRIGSILGAYDDLMEVNRQRIVVLGKSRDLLLPRLISGELSVAAASPELEAAA
jgi:type I restriction enzyme S subunit